MDKDSLTPDDWFNIGFDTYFEDYLVYRHVSDFPSLEACSYFDRGWLSADSYQRSLL